MRIGFFVANKNFWPSKPQEHQACVGDAIPAPLRYSRRTDLT